MIPIPILQACGFILSIFGNELPRPERVDLQ